MSFERGDRVRVSRGDVVLEGEVLFLDYAGLDNVESVHVDVGGSGFLEVYQDSDPNCDQWRVEKVVPPIVFKPFAVVKIVPRSLDDAFGPSHLVRLDDYWFDSHANSVLDDLVVRRFIAEGSAFVVFEGVDL